jgi:nitric oxide dioxygenase
MVGAALLWTLQQGLGDDYTPQVAAAWAALYDALASVMLRAAQQHTDEIAAERAARF